MALIGVSIAFVLWLPTDCPDNYLLASIDKENRLMQLQSSKIVVIGGSNTVFNIDSREISAATGLPVVNMGLHAGLGLQYMLNEVEAQIQADDILLIMPEYDQFFDRMFDGGRTTLHLIMLNPSVFRHIKTWRQTIALLKNVGLEARSKIVFLLGKNFNEEIYSRRSFDEFGDLRGEIIGSESQIDLQTENYWINAVQDIDKTSIRQMNRFYARATGKGVRVFLAFPPVSLEKYPNNRRNIIDMEDYFCQNVEIPLLISPGAVKIPAIKYFNTFYHLNTIGRQQYTSALIAALKILSESDK